MILWVRHGQSTWNVIDRMQGQAAHPPLTELGREQAGQVAENLANRGVTRVLSSPAVRARETADIIADRLGLVATVEPLLLELGLDEPIEEVLTRIQHFLALELPGNVVAVSHGDPIGLAVGMLSGQKPELPENCSITVVDSHTRAVEVTRVAELLPNVEMGDNSSPDTRAVKIFRTHETPAKRALRGSPSRCARSTPLVIEVTSGVQLTKIRSPTKNGSARVSRK